MRRAVWTVMVTAGCLFGAAPLLAHHNSPMNEYIDMPTWAEDTHNAAVEEVLLRLDENDRVMGAMEGARSTEMDPADSSNFEDSAPIDPVDFQGAGAERAPHL
jgi:hypothetical protein